jgi:anti-anti-sigma factor
VERRFAMRTLEVGAAAHVLTLTGELDGAVVPEIDAELQLLGNGHVIVDLLAVTFIDADGLAAITRAAQSRELTLVVDARIERLFKATALAGRVRVTSSLSTAVAEAV